MIAMVNAAGLSRVSTDPGDHDAPIYVPTMGRNAQHTEVGRSPTRLAEGVLAVLSGGDL